MKKFWSVALLFLSVFCVRGSAAPTYRPGLLPPEEVEQLVSPIALYPDPLVALLLPAATFPSEVVLAARFLERGGPPEATSVQPWDDSVRALARYREVIDYLDDHLEWTRRLGQGFLEQPDDVMEAIQMVRIRARAAGLLRDTPQQHVIIAEDEVCIVPAQPSVIYVPRYDPWVISRPSIPLYASGPFITFGFGWRVGAWLNFDCDWRSRAVRVVNRPPHWYQAPRWDDRDRFRQFTTTEWTRHRSYPTRDRRFDRSPRTVEYQVPGRDHRDWSDRSRSDYRDDRFGWSRLTHSNGYSGDRSPDWLERSRTNPVIPPVALPAPVMPRPEPSARRPERRPAAATPDRSRGPDRPWSEAIRQPVSSGPVTANPAPIIVSRPPTTERAAPANPPVTSERPPSHRDREDDDRRPESRRFGRDDERAYAPR